MKNMVRRKRHAHLLRLLLLLLMVFAVSACGGSAGSEPAASNDMSEMDGTEEMDHQDMSEMGDEHEHDDMSMNRVPNNGATIQITAPQNGAAFSAGEQVVVEIETENFDLSQEDYHWHVYIDGESWGMVMGGNKDQPLTGLEPGEHMIEVHLSLPTHEELEDGDSIMITVTE